MSLRLCVLLWPRPNAAGALTDYEDRVLALMGEHGGVVLQRVAISARVTPARRSVSGDSSTVCCCGEATGNDDRAEDRDCEHPGGGNPIVEDRVGGQCEQRPGADWASPAKE
jgi:hypothetical protein